MRNWTAPELITSCFQYYLIFAVLSSGAAAVLRLTDSRPAYLTHYRNNSESGGGIGHIYRLGNHPIWLRILQG